MRRRQDAPHFNTCDHTQVINRPRAPQHANKMHDSRQEYERFMKYIHSVSRIAQKREVLILWFRAGKRGVVGSLCVARCLLGCHQYESSSVLVCSFSVRQWVRRSVSACARAFIESHCARIGYGLFVFFVRIFGKSLFAIRCPVWTVRLVNSTVGSTT